MRRKLDYETLVGKTVNKLTIHGITRINREYWADCTCACGVRRSIRAFHIVNAQTKSCGCLRHDPTPHMTHGHARHGRVSREYIAWVRINARCHNPKHHRYSYYGERGISVCAEWRASFERFLADVGTRPSDGHSLERIDNDGNYEPSNVRWATKREQANNRRSGRMLTFGGRTMTLAQWATERGINQATLKNRLDRSRWPIEKALTHDVPSLPSK